MKIAIDGRLYGLEHAGLGRYVLNLVEGLKKIDKNNKYYLLLRKKYFNQLKLPSNWQKVLCDIPHYSLTEQIGVPKLLNSLDVDFVHFLHFNVPLFYSKPFIVTIHDILMHSQKGSSASFLPAPVYYLKRIGYWRVFKHAVEDSQRIIVPSNYSKDEIVNYYKVKPEKISVTYEGFDEKIKNLLPAKKILVKYGLTEPYFIYIGNAYPHKNLDRLIEAFTCLNETKKDKVKLAIVSSRNEFVARLDKSVRGQKAQGFIKLLGFVPDEDLGVLLANSCAFVFPSLMEGFGLPGLEALATGTLVLASDIPVFKEVFKDHAEYFNPYDFSSIQKGIEDALALDEGKRKELIETGKKFAKGYSWDKMAKDTLKIYADCTRLRQGQ